MQAVLYQALCVITYLTLGYTEWSNWYKPVTYPSSIKQTSLFHTCVSNNRFGTVYRHRGRDENEYSRNDESYLSLQWPVCPERRRALYYGAIWLAWIVFRINQSLPWHIFLRRSGRYGDCCRSTYDSAQARKYSIAIVVNPWLVDIDYMIYLRH